MKKQLQGTIISDKMEKTMVVKVERIKKDLKLKRRFKVHKKYKVHSGEQKDLKAGDKVVIEECSPISKEKHWRIIKKL